MNKAQRLSPFVVLWLLVLCGAASFVAYKVTSSSPFYSNIMDLLPEDERNPALNTLTQTLAGSFENRLLILLRAPNDQDSVQQARQLQSQLTALPGVMAAKTASHWLSTLQDIYRPHLSGLLTVDARQRVEQFSAQQLAEQQLQQLLSPLASPRLFSFAEDPFALGSEWLNQQTTAFNISLFAGWPAVFSESGERWMVVTAELSASAFDVSVQEAITAVITEHRTLQPQTELLTSGLVFHAAAGTQQAKQEISSVGLGSLLGIVALVLLVFRSAAPLALVVSVLSGGCLLALAACLLVFERIHLVTLVFGSTLLGVSVDYAFHFLVKARRYRSGSQAIAAVRLALAVGALTSISAYLLQWLAPFPGLQQMAIFSASGLLGAWLTLLCCGHFYTDRTAAQINQVETWVTTCLKQLSTVLSIRRSGIVILLGMTALVALVTIFKQGSNDSVASLNTSGPELLASEAKVQALLRYPSSQQFFWVRTEQQQALLTTLEQLKHTLHRQLPEVTTHSVIDYVPSIERQAQQTALVNARLYNDAGALTQLCARLAMDCEQQRQALQQQTAPLHWEKVANSSAASLLPPVIYEAGEWHSLLTVTLNNTPRAQLQQIAGAQEGVTFVDQGEQLTRLLAQYRQHVSVLLAVTLLILALAMWLRYRQRAWRMLVPLYLSLIIAMACAALGGGLTLFHMAALLLVLGIGVDTGVFYLEVGLQPDSWLAATLASFTSMLAFGLLSLSQVPVLQQFGVVVLSGILCCWLVTPMFFNPEFSMGNAKDRL